MSVSIKIVDESPAGVALNHFTLENLTERVTVRELIRARIHQEVQDHNRSQQEVFNGLVQPGESIKVANGYRHKKSTPIDWEEQFEKACKAFETNGFFILLENRQLDELDEVIELPVETEISFVKLIPLVGG